MLTELTVKNYLEELKSKAPAPGGGSVSALSAAQGAALGIMVTELTLGRERYAEYEENCVKVKEELTGLYEKLRSAVDEDTMAYLKVSDAFKLPKETEAEKQARSKAIREATKTATEVPFKVMEFSLAALREMEKLIGKANPNAASDIGVGAINLETGIRGAWQNVKINLPGLKDEELIKSYTSKSQEILDEAE
ncbi:MAG: cyclodeaminase/cyclohydrolase family protein, partial [Anaerovoracaceae bacterium]